MLAKPKMLTTMGLVQILLAASFSVWLLLWPSTGGQFAWPVMHRLTAMFIGASFLVRTYMGLNMVREKYWYRLRWAAWGTYGFLAVILLATFWHVEAMNWTSNIVVAHIWVLAYIIEPLMLPLVEPRGPQRNQPLPPELREGPILVTLKWLCAAGFIIGVAIAGLLLINPAFMNTRWPWPLDPFDARIMAAFATLAGVLALQVYLAEDWAEAKVNVISLALFAVAHFVVWLINLPRYDFDRPNVWTYGILFSVFAVLLVFHYWWQQRAPAPIPAPASQTVEG